jgi:hypothetical protein
LTLIVVCIVTLYFLQQLNVKKDRYEELAGKQADSLLRSQLYSYALSYGDIIDVPLTKDMLLIDSTMKTTTVGQVVNQRTYIFHFDETNCFTCVEKYIPYLLRLSKKLGNDRVVILGSYQNPVNLFIALEPFNLSQSGIKVFNLSPSYLANSKLGRINVPYIFEIDKYFHTTRFFIPEKSLNELSELYEQATIS